MEVDEEEPTEHGGAEPSTVGDDHAEVDPEGEERSGLVGNGEAPRPCHRLDRRRHSGPAPFPPRWRTRDHPDDVVPCVEQRLEHHRSFRRAAEEPETPERVSPPGAAGVVHTPRLGAWRTASPGRARDPRPGGVAAVLSPASPLGSPPRARLGTASTSPGPPDDSSLLRDALRPARCHLQLPATDSGGSPWASSVAAPGHRRVVATCRPLGAIDGLDGRSTEAHVPDGSLPVDAERPHDIRHRRAHGVADDQTGKLGRSDATLDPSRCRTQQLDAQGVLRIASSNHDLLREQLGQLATDLDRA